MQPLHKIAIMREIQSGSAGMENKSVINKEKSFTERVMLPGEIAEIKDKHTLAFCFGDGNISYLNFDESVSEETAKELIEKIKQFLERNRIR